MADVIKFKLNGKPVEMESPGGTAKLLGVLRDSLLLTGTKYGCGEGECGACTVLLDGKAVRSCMTRLSTVQERNVTTIEGLQQNGHLHPVQEAFLKMDAMQCAYCTSGMIMSCCALLEKNKNPSEEEIVTGMNGNICRCGAYQRIIAAVQEAARTTRGEA